MGLSDRIPGLQSGYRWIDQRSPVVRGGLFVVALALSIPLADVPTPEDGYAPTEVIVGLFGVIAMLVAVLSIISLTSSWIVEQSRLVRAEVFVGALAAYLLLPRSGALMGTISMVISLILLVVAGLVVWSTVSEFRQRRNRSAESPAVDTGGD